MICARAGWLAGRPRQCVNRGMRCCPLPRPEPWSAGSCHRQGYGSGQHLLGVGAGRPW